jgi:2-polyprenyl-3-methyl-5-hydroxy-6-metoxy-1,4-benzoquinol methylase
VIIPCRSCASKDAKFLFRKDEFDIVQCKACGLKFTNADPSHTHLKEFYGEKYFHSEGMGTSYSDYLFEEKAMSLNAEKRLQKIEKIMPARGKILDLGCAAGFFLNVANREWEVAGVELSEYASSYAMDRFGLPVRNGTLKDAAFPDKGFDVVTMWDVVEHLTDPLEDLKEARRVMKDDGLLVMTTGDVESFFAKACGKHWHLYNPTQHLSFFSRKTITGLLEKAGFKVLKIEKDGNHFTLAYLTSSLSMYYPFILTKVLHKLISATFLKNVSICIDLKDIMTVYAVKK